MRLEGDLAPHAGTRRGGVHVWVAWLPLLCLTGCGAGATLTQGAPRPGAEVATGIHLCLRELARLEPVRTLVEDARGCYKLAEPLQLPPGRYRVVVAVAGRGYENSVFEFELEASAEHAYELAVAQYTHTLEGSELHAVELRDVTIDRLVGLAHAVDPRTGKPARAEARCCTQR